MKSIRPDEIRADFFLKLLNRWNSCGLFLKVTKSTKFVRIFFKVTKLAKFLILVRTARSAISNSAETF